MTGSPSAGKSVPPPPAAAFLHTSLSCNSKCAYCWVWKKKVPPLPAEDLLGAIDQLGELGVRLVCLGGGEPFLHPDLPSLIRRVRERGCMAAIATNGASHDRVLTRAVLDAGLDILMISLDTIDPSVYRSIRGIRLERVLSWLEHVLRLRKRFPKLEVRVSCVLSKANLGQVPEVVRYCGKRKVIVGVQPLHDVYYAGGRPAPGLALGKEDAPRARKLIDELKGMKRDGYLIDNDGEYLDHIPAFLGGEGLPKGFRCRGGFDAVFVDEKLDVRSCWYRPPLGSLREGRLTELWASAPYAEAREAMLGLDCPGCWSGCGVELSMKLAKGTPRLSTSP